MNLLSQVEPLGFEVRLYPMLPGADARAKHPRWRSRLLFLELAF